MTRIGRIVDVSSNNHPNNQPIDWPIVAKAGVTTAFVKATEGTTYVNPWMAQDVAGAAKAGLAVRCYHFAKFTNVQAEADWFRQHAGPFARVGDFETSTNVTWMRAFLLALGAPPSELLAYGSASSLVGIYHQLPAMAWVAAYQAHSPGWGVLWQYTQNGSVAGITGHVDLNNWQGSEIQYETYFRLYAPPPPIVSRGGNMLAATPTGKGFWRLDATGAITTYGDAQYLGGPNTSKKPDGTWGGPPELPAGQACVSIASSVVPGQSGQQGYWIESNVGSIYAYGDAPFLEPN